MLRVLYTLLPARIGFKYMFVFEYNNLVYLYLKSQEGLY